MENDKDLEILKRIKSQTRIGRKKGGGKKQNFIRTHFFLLKKLREAGASWQNLADFIKIKYGKTMHFNTIRREYLQLQEKEKKILEREKEF